MSDKPKQFFNVVALDPPNGYWSTKDPTVFHAHTLETTGVDLRGTEFRIEPKSLANKICGHEREDLRWALKTRAALETGWIPFTMGGRILPRESRNVALESLNDHAKLAAIIAELMRGHGLGASDSSNLRSNDVSPYWILVTNYDDSVGRIVVNCFDRVKGTWHHYVTMPKARAFALRLLDAPTATAQDIERMIGEL